jgi:predicted RNA methylase
MNPPFGTKNNEGIDMLLLKAASESLKPGGQLFSLHKASTKTFIEKFIKEKITDCKGEMLSIIKFDLPKTYRFQKQKNVEIEVVLVKVTKNSDLQ